MNLFIIINIMSCFWPVIKSFNFNNFIIYIKEILAEDIVQIYIKEVFTRYRVLVKIILN